MAYGVMRKLLEEAGIQDLEVRTAGVMTVPGLLPTQEVRQMLLKDGIDISNHRSCQLTGELIKRAYLVLGMTSFHVQMALRMAESARLKTHLLKAFAGFDPKNDQVQDPMGCTLEVYKRVYREIRNACKRLMKVDAICPPNGAKSIEPDAPLKKGEKKPARKKKEAAAISGNGTKATTAGKVTLDIKPKSAAASAAKIAVPAAKSVPPAAKSASLAKSSATAKAAAAVPKAAAPAVKGKAAPKIAIKAKSLKKAETAASKKSRPAKVAKKTTSAA
jgi:protein-tyrosine-phosphatase